MVLLFNARNRTVAAITFAFVLIRPFAATWSDPPNAEVGSMPDDVQSAGGTHRPPLDFDGRYNIPIESSPKGANVWRESSDLPPVSHREFQKVYRKVSDIVARAAKRTSATDHDRFYVVDEFYGDRTLVVEVEPSEDTRSFVGRLIPQLQESLSREFPLWRVSFPSIALKQHSVEEDFVVYPNVVRIAQLDVQHSLPDALRANIDLRLQRMRARIQHQKRRRNLLREEFEKAKGQLGEISFVCLAWCDTISSLTIDHESEGQPGTSIWLLFQPPIEPNVRRRLKSTLDNSVFWADSDGNIVDTGSRPVTDKQLFQIILFEDQTMIHDEISFELNSKRHNLQRPSMKES